MTERRGRRRRVADPSRARGARSVRAGEAGRGGAARARPRARRQARLERRARTDPSPEAQEAIARAALELNRYPDGGAWRLRSALAERHGVRFEQVTVCAGADAVVGYVCQATLDPGDEVVTGWPSFPSYVLDPLKLGGVPVRVPLGRRAHRPRRAARRDHAAHEARLHRRAEQPDRDDERPGGARRVLRARPAARSHGARPGVLRVRRGSGATRMRSRSTSPPGDGCSSCARSRRSSGWPACGSATASGPRTSSRPSARCAARST